MSSMSVTDTVPAQGETFHDVLLRLWDDVEQTLTAEPTAPQVPVEVRTDTVSARRRASEGATPSRVRFAFD